MERSILSEIEELTKTKAKYDNMKTKYLDIAKKLQEARSIIDDAINELDPYLKNISRETRKRGLFVDAVSELQEKLQQGTEISLELIQHTYPDFTIEQHRWIFNLVSKTLGVKKRKEGRTAYLFYPKEWK
jgi:uncharacterized coiled-coil DUF342 family protein